MLPVAQPPLFNWKVPLIVIVPLLVYVAAVDNVPLLVIVPLFVDAVLIFTEVAAVMVKVVLPFIVSLPTFVVPVVLVTL